MEVSMSVPQIGVWFKSSFSTPANTGCVETMFDGRNVHVRDTKAGPDARVQVYNQTEWDAFIAGARAGEFDFFV